MDEARLRELLDRATRDEPPIGPIAASALQAGIRLRRRRRAKGASACAAAVAVIAVAVPAATTSHHAPGRVFGHRHGQTVYAISTTAAGNAVTPIAVSTNRPGKPIRVGDSPLAAALTPNGKTLYVTVARPAAVVPVSTRTDKPGKAISVALGPFSIAMAPNGRTAYVVSDLAHGVVTPIDTATNTAERPIPAGNQPAEIAITPDSKTGYVLNQTGVLPINLATNQAGREISVGAVS